MKNLFRPGFVMRDFGPLRVIVWDKPYLTFGRDGWHVYLQFWRPEFEPDYGGSKGSWEARILWFELRWRVHNGVRVDD